PTVWFIACGKRRWRRPDVAAFAQDLDAAFSLFKARVTKAGQVNAALVQRERLLERQVALLELLDDRVELRDRGLEIFNGSIGHVETLHHGVVYDLSRTSQFNSPFSSVTRTPSPRCTDSASRIIRVRSSFQQTAYPRPRTASGLSASSRLAQAPGCACARWRRRVIAASSFPRPSTSRVRIAPSRRPTSNISRFRRTCSSRRLRAAMPPRIVRASAWVNSAASRPRSATRPG